MNIAYTVKSKRQSLGLTQIELAERVGVSRTYLADIEAGRYIPSVKVLAKIAEALSLSIFFTESGGNTSSS